MSVTEAKPATGDDTGQDPPVATPARPSPVEDQHGVGGDSASRAEVRLGSAGHRTAAAPETCAGRVTIAPAVVARLAARAALDVPAAGGAATRGIGRALPGTAHRRGSDAGLLPHSSAAVDGSTAVIDLSITVQWPESLARVTTDVRDRVIARVAELTGLTVARVGITVSDLIRDEAPARVQ